MAFRLGESNTEANSDEKRSYDIMKEQFFENILTSIKDYAIYLIDLEGKIIFWNKGAEKILGYTSEEVSGKHFSMFYLPSEKNEKFTKDILLQASQKGRVEIEGWRIGKDEDKFWANVTITPHKDDDGNISGYVKIIRDLSERMAAEQVISEYEVNLLEQSKHTEKLKELYFTFLSMVEDYAIFMLDEHGMVLDWNPGAEKIKGYKPDEIIGKHFSTFYTDEDKKIAKYNKLLLRARVEGRVNDEGWRLRKDGTRFWANVTITSLRDAQGQVTGYTKITRDLTNAKEAERQAAEYTTKLEMEIEKVKNRDEQLRHTYEKMKQTAEVRSKFLAAAATDMVVPLENIIKTSLQLRDAAQTGGDEQITEQLENIMWSAYVSKKTMKDLGILSALLQEAVSVKSEDINLDELIRKVINTDNKAYKVTQKINYSPSGIDSYFQSGLHIEYILENILLNAAMYSPKDSTITIAVKCEDEDCVIAVEDEGPGISEEDQERLYENFFRGSNSKGKEGSGLSLSNSKKLAKLMGGDIEYKYEPGKGSTFIVRTPIRGKA